VTLRTCWDPHIGGWYELVGELEFNTAVQGAIERTMHRVGTVDILDRVACIVGRYQAMQPGEQPLDLPTSAIAA